MATLWLGLGSNIGDRRSHITEAVSRLGGFVHGIERGDLYETAPRDYLAQDDFLNTVIRGDCALPPAEILHLIHKIEQDGGRNRRSSPEKGPRTIDIDILLIDDLVFTADYGDGLVLTVPHLSMHERLFVLQPFLDLNPQALDPRDGERWSVKASHLLEQRVKLFPT